MAKKAVSLPTVTNSLYDLLEPLEPADRMRAINAALTLLGDVTIGGSGEKRQSTEDEGDHGAEDGPEVHAKARAWMRKYKVTPEQLEHVFQFDDEQVEVIADDVPARLQRTRR